MNKLSKITVIICVVALSVSYLKAEPLKMVFSSKEQVVTFNWKLNDFSPALPDDWSGYKFLVLEIKASSSERFSLGPITPDGPVYKSIRPFPSAWLRFCVPLEFYQELPASAATMSAVYNKPRPLGMINIHSSDLNPLTKVEGLSFSMRSPLNDPTIEIRAAYLSVENPGDTVMQEGFLVDRFGQWATEEWPGKIKSETQLQQEWKNESAALRPLDLNKYSQYGGYKQKKVKATGFFRIEKIDGVWWFVDPEGYLFLSHGSDCIIASTSTPTAGREYIFEGLKTIPTDPDRPNRRGGADYYDWNLQARYGENYSSEWVKTAILRMNTWGLNTVANWSSPEFVKASKVPFTLSIRGLQLGGNLMGLADIYAPDCEAKIEEAIKNSVEPYKDNKWLLGYFIGNEPPWPGEEKILCDRILASDTPMKAAFVKYLEKHGNNDQTKVDFVYETFEKFLEMVNKYFKKYAPNHLNLGMRYVGVTTDRLITIIGKNLDVFSINAYSHTPSKEYLDRLAKLTDRPVIIGEYHFGTPGRGMSAGLVKVSSYQERGIAYQYYNEQGYTHPSLIGAHWFQWIDQPNTGRGDGENYNIGILDITDRPYPDMVKAIKITFERLYDVHSGKLAPFNRP
jgi:hypothetical protein